ncbi:MAG TPA: hypothetical protein VFJ61_03975 [Solirubrobacterales bacterium]|nr:hypothetical protein [Solirubrobacterales bacterium]
MIELAPEHVGDFMWMHEHELEDGTRIHGYKHWETRRYLHLDHGGRAFVYVWKDGQDLDEPAEYEEVDSTWLLEIVLAKPEERARVFRQDVAAEFKRLKWTRSATKHRVSRKRIRHALEHCLLILEEDPPAEHPTATDKRLVFLGTDGAGVDLEVITAEAAKGNLLVIHAMEMRARYRSAYEEVRRWLR